MSDLLSESQAPALPYRLIEIALLPTDRARLHERIAIRFKAMLAAGLLDEVRRLRGQYRLDPDLPAMRCVGYRQAWRFLEGEIDSSELCEAGVAATRQLAKRQTTWLRSWQGAEGFDCLRPDLVDRIAEWLATRLPVTSDEVSG